MESSNKTYLLITVLVFASVSVIHLIRAINGWPFIIGPYELPLAVSWVGFAFTALLSGWAVKLLVTAPQ